jgi:mRNA interferase MazF
MSAVNSRRILNVNLSPPRGSPTELFARRTSPPGCRLSRSAPAGADRSGLLAGTSAGKEIFTSPTEGWADQNPTHRSPELATTKSHKTDRHDALSIAIAVWADLGPPAGRRPVCVLTRDAAVAVLSAITCAPITRTIRGIRSEVEVGTAEGLPAPSVVNCDNLITIPLASLDDRPVGHLDAPTRVHLDRALRYALDIEY